MFKGFAAFQAKPFDLFSEISHLRSPLIGIRLLTLDILCPSTRNSTGTEPFSTFSCF